MTQSVPRKVNARRQTPGGGVYVSVGMSKGLAARLNTIAKERGIPRNQLIRELLTLSAYQ